MSENQYVIAWLRISTYILDRNIENLMKELGFTQQIPQEEAKENAPISGSITFIGNGELKKMRDRVDKEMNEQRSQRKKENK